MGQVSAHPIEATISINPLQPTGAAILALRGITVMHAAPAGELGRSTDKEPVLPRHYI